MARDATLALARREAETGNPYKARDRLHGLLSTYPGDLEVRRTLGDIYAQLGNYAMAGRYWYLEEVSNEQMAAARTAFEREQGGDLHQIARALKLRQDLTSVPPGPLRETLAEMQRGYQLSDTTTQDKVVLGCVLSGAAGLIGLAITGFVAVSRWVGKIFP